ncbi:TPA: MFS transporter [Enterococcus faecalis]|uniref:MFS transporter n=1 Tax=Enterococcus faecalis TaxID=1351 RepID=UPI0013E94DF4|nr:MFS transporter [Enterococcus faecalis]MDV2931544.1 MFS transporter [Enterococcus faecalis]HED9418580.1 MFS transporter [Enterococcus faecalis]
MKKIRKQYYFYNLLSNAAIQIFSAVSYIYIIQNGFSYMEANLYLSIFWIVCTLAEVPSGVLVDSIGARKTLFLGYGMRFLGLICLVWLPNFSVLLISGILTALAEALQSGTLETWLTNEGKIKNSEFSIQKIYSKTATYRLSIGLILGYLGSQLYSKINIKLPFEISAILFFSLALLVLFNFAEESLNHSIRKESKESFFKTYKKSVRSALNYSKKNKYFWIVLFILLVPVINDIGPSNQWQSYISTNENQIDTGLFFVFISISGIVANFLMSKWEIKKTKIKNIFLAFALMDICIVITLSINLLPPTIFFMHVFLLQVLSTITITILHDDLITEDSVRGTMISIYNTIEGIIMSITLILNGYISDRIGFQEAWLIASMFTLLLLSILWVTMILRRRFHG